MEHKKPNLPPDKVELSDPDDDDDDDYYDQNHPHSSDDSDEGSKSDDIRHSAGKSAAAKRPSPSKSKATKDSGERPRRPPRKVQRCESKMRTPSAATAVNAVERMGKATEKKSSLLEIKKEDGKDDVLPPSPSQNPRKKGQPPSSPSEKRTSLSSAGTFSFLDTIKDLNGGDKDPTTEPLREFLSQLLSWFRSFFSIEINKSYDQLIKKEDLKDAKPLPASASASPINLCIPHNLQRLIERLPSLKHIFSSRKIDSEVAAVLLFGGFCQQLDLQVRYVKVVEPFPVHPQTSKYFHFWNPNQKKSLDQRKDFFLASPHSKYFTREKNNGPLWQNNRIIDHWLEIALPGDGKWVNIDVINGRIGSPHFQELLRISKGYSPLRYVVALNDSLRDLSLSNDDQFQKKESHKEGKEQEKETEKQQQQQQQMTITDVTWRYTTGWDDALKQRLGSDMIDDQLWWEETLQQLSDTINRPFSKSSRIQIAIEDIQKTELEMSIAIPKSDVSIRHHPIYCLEKFLNRYSMIHPEKRHPVGKFKGEDVFLRRSAIELKSNVGLSLPLLLLSFSRCPL